MHVFVTGATGFIGYHTVLALAAAGHSVRLGVRNAEKMRQLYANSGIDVSDYAVGEITDAVSIDRALQDCNAVVHTAAMVSLDPGDEQRMRHTNLTGTQRVIGGAVERGIRSIVHVSSIVALFNPRVPRIHEALPVATPASAYARSKVECDQYVRGLIEAGANILLTYPSAVVGPDDPAMSEGNHGLAYFFNNTFIHTTTGMQFIDVRELASVQTRLLEQQKSGYYLVSGHYLPYRELGALMESITGRKLRKVAAPRLLLRALGHIVDFIDGHITTLDTPLTLEAVTYAADWVYADDSKVRGELDLEYRSLRETLTDTVAWLAAVGQIDRQWADDLQRRD
jgi:dihydroflavonol-4-reductase